MDQAIKTEWPPVPMLHLNGQSDFIWDPETPPLAISNNQAKVWNINDLKNIMLDRQW